MPCLNLLLDYNNLLLDYNNLLLDYNNLLPDYNNHIIIYYCYNPRININPSCPERTEVAMVVLIGLVVYFLGVDIHESAMEAFLALIRYNQLNIKR